MRISDWSSDVCSSDLEGVILEVIPERKVVFTDAFAMGWIPKKPFILGVFSFEPEGEGTRYRGIARHWDDAAMKQNQEMGFEQGWSAVAAQLAEVAENIGSRTSDGDRKSTRLNSSH